VHTQVVRGMHKWTSFFCDFLRYSFSLMLWIPRSLDLIWIFGYFWVCVMRCVAHNLTHYNSLSSFCLIFGADLVVFRSLVICILIVKRFKVQFFNRLVLKCIPLISQHKHHNLYNWQHPWGRSNGMVKAAKCRTQYHIFKSSKHLEFIFKVDPSLI
jgi:hypothetical protein